MGYLQFISQRRVSNQEMVTILKEGVLGINKLCTENHFKGFKFAALYYDKEKRKIAIQPTNNPSRGTSNILFIKQGTLAKISAKSFLRYCGITHEQSTAYPAIWNEREKLVEIKLSDEE